MANIQAKASSYSRTSSLDYLARLFEDPDIDDSGSGNALEKRLRNILSDSHNPDNPILHFSGVLHGLSDSGFRRQFKDPWATSSNQCGHFMTAVDMGFDPLKTYQYVSTRIKWANPLAWSLSGGIPPTIPVAERICAMLIVGHEQSADNVSYSNTSYFDGWFSSFRQATSASSEQIDTFLNAVRVLPNDPVIDVRKSQGLLPHMQINVGGEGNSMQDLLLSLFGFKFGSRIRLGNLATLSDAGKWIRTNIGDPV